MTQEFCLHESTKAQFWQLLRELLASGKKWRISIKEWREKRSLGQNDLSHVWYEQISKYLVSKGRTECSTEWVKLAMKHTYLGYEKKVMTDVVTGEKKEVLTLKKTSGLDAGAMHYYLSQVESWSLHIGCMLRTPDDCEYKRLQREQVK